MPRLIVTARAVALDSDQRAQFIWKVRENRMDGSSLAAIIRPSQPTQGSMRFNRRMPTTHTKSSCPLFQSLRLVGNHHAAPTKFTRPLDASFQLIEKLRRRRQRAWLARGQGDRPVQRKRNILND